LNAGATRRSAFLPAFLLAFLVGMVFSGGELADARRSLDHALTVVQVDDLPREARETLELIKQGGPFPYKRDGVVFANRERRLPVQSGDYYREYTVPTPGARDRGARRIIAGESGEYYYTGDHYKTFRRIRE
jgi:ribonuclease T1